METALLYLLATASLGASLAALVLAVATRRTQNSVARTLESAARREAETRHPAGSQRPEAVAVQPVAARPAAVQPPPVVVHDPEPTIRQGPPSPTPRSNRLVAEAPMVDGVPLRSWLVHYNPRRDGDGCWARVVAEFYNRAAADPEIASYFRNTDLDALRGHFTRALILVTANGLTAGAVEAMRNRHAAVTDADGRPITGPIYDRVIGVLVDILTETGVPRRGIAALAETIAPLREVIVRG